jgi:Glucosamine-6-phosphate isomerases/6-phosphogluconolactonase
MTFQPEIHRHADFDALARSLSAWTQALLAAGIATRGRASLVVPGGRTPAPWFDLLSQADLAWDRVRVTLTDERWVDAGHPASNERLVRERLLRGKAAAAVLAGLHWKQLRGLSTWWCSAWAKTVTSPRCFQAMQPRFAASMPRCRPVALR